LHRVIALSRAFPQFPTAGRIVSECKDENLPERIYECNRIIYRIEGIPKIILMFLLL